MNQFQQPINSFRKSGAIPTTNYSSQATTPHNNKITAQALSQQQTQVAALQPSKQSNSAGISTKQHKDKDVNQNLNINIAAASQKGNHTNSQVTTANSQRLQAAQKLQWQSQNQDRNHPQTSALQTQLNSKPFQPKTVAADKSHNKPCNSAKKNEPQITKANEDLFESNRETEQAQANLVVNVMTSTNQQQQKFIKINSFSNSEQHEIILQKQDNNFTNNQDVGEQKNSVLGQVNFSVTVNSHHNHLRAKSKGVSTQQVQTPNVVNPIISDSRFLKNNLISKSQPDTDALKMPDSREQKTDFSFIQQDKNGLQSPQDFTPNLIKEGQKTLGQKNGKIESAVGLINFQKQEKESNPPPPSPQTGKHFELFQKTEKFCILKFLKKLEEIKQIKEMISETEIMDVDLDLKNQRTIKVDAIRTRISEIKALIDCYPSPFQKDAIPELIEKILTAYCKRLKIEYKQGINEILGPFFYLALQNSQKNKIISQPMCQSFNALKMFIEIFIPTMYIDDEFCALQSSFCLLRILLKYHDPKICRLLHSAGCPPELYASSWFFTIFANRCARIDLVFTLWSKMLFQNSEEENQQGFKGRNGISFTILPQAFWKQKPIFTLSIALIILNRDQILATERSNLPIIMSSLRISNEEQIEQLLELAQQIYEKTPISFWENPYMNILYGENSTKFYKQKMSSQQRLSLLAKLESYHCMPITVPEFFKNIVPDYSYQSSYNNFLQIQPQTNNNQKLPSNRQKLTNNTITPRNAGTTGRKSEAQTSSISRTSQLNLSAQNSSQPKSISSQSKSSDQSLLQDIQMSINCGNPKCFRFLQIRSSIKQLKITIKLAKFAQQNQNNENFLKLKVQYLQAIDRIGLSLQENVGGQIFSDLRRQLSQQPYSQRQDTGRAVAKVSPRHVKEMDGTNFQQSGKKQFIGQKIEVAQQFDYNQKHNSEIQNLIDYGPFLIGQQYSFNELDDSQKFISEYEEKLSQLMKVYGLNDQDQELDENIKFIDGPSFAELCENCKCAQQKNENHHKSSISTISGHQNQGPRLIVIDCRAFLLQQEALLPKCTQFEINDVVDIKSLLSQVQQRFDSCKDQVHICLVGLGQWKVLNGKNQNEQKNQSTTFSNYADMLENVWVEGFQEDSVSQSFMFTNNVDETQQLDLPSFSGASRQHSDQSDKLSVQVAKSSQFENEEEDERIIKGNDNAGNPTSSYTISNFHQRILTLLIEIFYRENFKYISFLPGGFELSHNFIQMYNSQLIKSQALIYIHRNQFLEGAEAVENEQINFQLIELVDPHHPQNCYHCYKNRAIENKLENLFLKNSENQKKDDQQKQNDKQQSKSKDYQQITFTLVKNLPQYQTCVDISNFGSSSAYLITQSTPGKDPFGVGGASQTFDVMIDDYYVNELNERNKNSQFENTSSFYNVNQHDLEYDNFTDATTGNKLEVDEIMNQKINQNQSEGYDLFMGIKNWWNDNVTNNNKLFGANTFAQGPTPQRHSLFTSNNLQGGRLKDYLENNQQNQEVLKQMNVTDQTRQHIRDGLTQQAQKRNLNNNSQIDKNNQFIKPHPLIKNVNLVGRQNKQTNQFEGQKAVSSSGSSANLINNKGLLFPQSHNNQDYTIQSAHIQLNKNDKKFKRDSSQENSYIVCGYQGQNLQTNERGRQIFQNPVGSDSRFKQVSRHLNSIEFDGSLEFAGAIQQKSKNLSPSPRGHRQTIGGATSAVQAYGPLILRHEQQQILQKGTNSTLSQNRNKNFDQKYKEDQGNDTKRFSELPKNMEISKYHLQPQDVVEDHLLGQRDTVKQEFSLKSELDNKCQTIDNEKAQDKKKGITKADGNSLASLQLEERSYYLCNGIQKQQSYKGQDKLVYKMVCVDPLQYPQDIVIYHVKRLASSQLQQVIQSQSIFQAQQELNTEIESLPVYGHSSRSPQMTTIVISMFTTIVLCQLLNTIQSRFFMHDLIKITSRKSSAKIITFYFRIPKFGEYHSNYYKSLEQNVQAGGTSTVADQNVILETYNQQPELQYLFAYKRANYQEVKMGFEFESEEQAKDCIERVSLLYRRLKNSQKDQVSTGASSR